MTRRILKHLPAVVYEADAFIEESKFRIKEIRFLSEWVERLTGWSLEEIRSNPDWWFENIHPEDREKVLVDYKSLARGTDVISMSYRLRRRDGTYVYILDTVSLVEVVDEKNIKVVGVWEDISRQQEYYEVFRAVDEAPAVSILIYQEKVVYANKTTLQMLGYSEEEIKRLEPHELVAPEHRNSIKEIIRKRLRGE